MIVFQISIYTDNENKLHIDGARMVSDHGRSPPTQAENIVADSIGEAVNTIAEGLTTIFGEPIEKQAYDPNKKI